MLSLLDKYVIKRFLFYFFIGLFVFISLFLITDFISKFSKYDTTIQALFKYYYYFLPEIIYQMLPVALVLSSLMTISTMSKNNELIAFYTTGVSIYRICLPIVVIAGLLCALAFSINDKIIPHVVRKKEMTSMKEVKKNKYKHHKMKLTGIRNRVWFRDEDLIVNVGQMDLTTRQGLDIHLFYMNENWDLTRIIRAESAKVSDKSWTLMNVSETDFTTENSFPIRHEYVSKVVEVTKKLSDLEIENLSSDFMSASDLRYFIRRNQQSGFKTSEYETDLWDKYTFSFAAFLLTLLSIPFAVSKRRSGGGMINIGICLAMVFGFWMLYTFALSLGRMGVVMPAIAAWSTHILILVCTFFLYSRVST